MATHSKAFGIDTKGRMLFSEAADTKLASKQFTSVGSSSATLLVSNDSTIKRRKLFIKNIGTAVVYIGDSTVSSTNGFPLYQFDELELDVNDAADIRARTAGTDVGVVHILEVE